MNNIYEQDYSVFITFI